MKTFQYQAIDAGGRLQQGTISAKAVSDANSQLHQRKLAPVAIESPRNSRSNKIVSLGARRVKTGDLILYTEQLLTMIRVGIPIIQALDTLHEQTEHPQLQAISQAIRIDIQDGLNLANSLRKHPKVFSTLYCTIVEAGEKSGNLPASMERLIYLIEHEESVKAEVKRALRYPFMVVIALAIAFVIMLGFVIPTFATFFDKVGLELPLPTRLSLGLSAFLLSYGWLIVIVIAVGVIGFRLLSKLPSVQLFRSALLLRTPIIGPILIKAAMSRFASIFAILQSSGILVLETIDTLSQSIDNAAISAQFLKLREALKEGQGISRTLRSAFYFPPLVINMIAVGEETGRLDEMLQSISDHYDKELSHTLKKMTDLIGPILIVLLLVIIGFFALAIYLPMWDLTKMAQ